VGFVCFVEISSPIEEVVSSICAYRVLKHIRIHRRDTAVIELVPLVCRWILTVSRIVTESHVAIVIGYGVQVVDELLSGMFITDDVFGEVEALQRERHVDVHLLTVAAATSEHTEVPTLLTALLEPLKVDNKNRWRLVNLELLPGSHVLLTFVAVPHIIIIKGLGFLELVEAVLYADCTLLLSSLVIATTIDSLAFLHA